MTQHNASNWTPQTSVNLQSFNTLALPVVAQRYARITQLEDLSAARNYCHQHGLNWLLLGGGSNMILTQDLQSLVMHMAIVGKHWVPAENLHCTVQTSGKGIRYLQVGGGENWDDLVAWSIAEGAYGLQNLSLIPGLVGAAPVQNIGAYGADISQILHEVMVYDFATDKQFCLSAAQCQLGYRDSLFKRQPNWIITSVTLALNEAAEVQVNYGDMAAYIEQQFACHANEATPQQVREAVIHIRSSKLPDPAHIPNVGSFFKNPIVSTAQAKALRNDYPNIVAYPHGKGHVKLAAGWLIDQLGWKGYAKGGVGVHKQQALVLIREPGLDNSSTGENLLALARQIQADVAKHYAVQLEVEPRIFASSGEIQI